MKQGLAEEKEQFLQILEDEKAKLVEEGLNLNIKLAAQNMAKERRKGLAIQEEVVLADDQVEGCLENGGGETFEEENLLGPPSDADQVQVEAEGSEGREVDGLINSENVEESEDGKIVGEVEMP